MNAKKEKKLLSFEKINLRISQKKIMALNLFEFLEQLIIDNFFLKLTQFEKTGSIRKDYISLRSLIIKFHFRN